METAVVAEAAGLDEHAHHSEDAPGETPEHEVCPDLAHCTVAAPVSAPELGSAAESLSDQRVLGALDRPTSAVTSVEPPPPKQS